MRRFVLVLLLTAFIWVPSTVFGQDAPDDSSNVVAAYPIHAGIVGGHPAPEHAKIWASVQALVPPPLLGLIDTLEFFQVAENPQAESATDGYAVLNETGTAFALGLNIESAKSAFIDRDPEALPEYQRTILHEFGHVLSFQPSQMDISGKSSGTLVIDEGTLRAESYLNQFHRQFWKKAFPKRDASTSSDEEGSALYQKNPGAFVTEYAATGPLEDFAESFAWFMAEPIPNGSTVKDLKVRFFSQWPELVSMRDTIQARLK